LESAHYLSEEHILIFLLQLCLLLGVAKVLGELGRKWGCPPLAGEILTGILLGPTILGRALPELQLHLFPPDVTHQTMLDTVSWLGVLFLLLITGFEVNVSSVWKQGRAAMTIGIIGVIVPMAVGCAVFWWLPERYYGSAATQLTFTLFMATAASISAITVIARVLHDLDVLRSDVGLTTLSGFIVNDLFGWLIFTVVLGLSTQGGGGFEKTVMVFVLIVSFGAFCLTIGSKLVGYVMTWLNKTNLPQPATTLAVVSCLGLACGAVTQAIGIHAILGFFIAGIMAGSSPAVSERSREIISQMIHAVFVPIFFASIGLKIDFLSNLDALVVVAFTLVAVGGKMGGAWLAAVLSKFSAADALAIGIAFIPGGAMEIILGMLALELKLISEDTFVAIVFAAILSSVIVGPLYAWAIRRQPGLDIGGILSKAGLLASIQGQDRWDVIPELCQRLPHGLAPQSQEEIQQAVREREELMGTGLEGGVAVPHARLPGLQKPVILFGRSQHGIEWDCRDGVPVKFVFLILTSEEQTDVQIPILSAIAMAMTNDDIRTSIETTSASDLHKTLSRALRDASKKRRS